MMGIRGTEWKAVVTVTEGMKYLEAEEWIYLVEAEVSERRKFPELERRCNGKIKYRHQRKSL